MKLIDADELLKHKGNCYDENGHLLYAVGTGNIMRMPTIDAVQVVRCRDCKYRIVNEHYGERGYLKLKAYCDLDTGDPFELGRNAEDDNWFCADGERRTNEAD